MLVSLIREREIGGRITLFVIGVVVGVLVTVGVPLLVETLRATFL